MGYGSICHRLLITTHANHPYLLPIWPTDPLWSLLTYAKIEYVITYVFCRKTEHFNTYPRTYVTNSELSRFLCFFYSSVPNIAVLETQSQRSHFKGNLNIHVRPKYLQIERRTGKVRRPKTDVLYRCATQPNIERLDAGGAKTINPLRARHILLWRRCSCCVLLTYCRRHGLRVRSPLVLNFLFVDWWRDDGWYQHVL